MESLVQGVKAALLDPSLAPVWFRQLLHQNVFQTGNFHVTLHQVQKYADREAHSSIDLTDMRTLLDHLQSVGLPQSRQSPISSLQLVKLYAMEPGDFLRLLELFRIDDGALLVLNSGPFHFQHFERPSTSSNKASSVVSFGLAYNVATMLWSFDPTTEVVRAVAIGEYDLPFNAVQIERFRSNLTHPLALGLLAMQIQLEAFHGTNRKLVNGLRDVETDTGHRGKNQSAGRMDFEILERLDLDVISQTVSNIHYEAFSLQRSFMATKKIVQEMADLTERNVLGNRVNNTSSGQSFKASLTWRLKSIESLLEQTQYLLNRVGVQETVVVNLRAKRDSTFSLKLAAESKELARLSATIAEAARKDSSSMQTIAVMTMAVLPATYFAALFAMPLLKWDQQPVIQEQFWIYLAFTLPSTAVVFLLWIIITKTNLLQSLFPLLQKESKVNSEKATRV